MAGSFKEINLILKFCGDYFYGLLDSAVYSQNV